jgi:hypothetical protein
MSVRDIGSAPSIRTLPSRRAALQAAGCEVIRSEKQSDSTTNDRAELRTVLS